MNRRSVLRYAAVGGAGALAATAVGCGDDDDESNGSPTTAGATSAPTSAPTPAIKAGGKTTVVAVEGNDLNPHTGISGNEQPLLFIMHDTLISYNEKAEVKEELSLAKSWEIPSPTEIVLKLRPGIKFHDGEPLTAEVVKYNIGVIQDPATASVFRATMANVTAVETPDSLTVVLKLAKPSASMLLALGDRPGVVVSRRALETKGLKGYAVEPIGGTGAYRFEKWTRNSNMTFKKNVEYWRLRAGAKLPHLDELELKFIPEAAVSLAALQSKQVTLADITAEDIPVVERQSDLSVVEFKGAGCAQLFMNRRLLSDPRVRQALTYALDREGMVAAITAGRGAAGLGPITNGQWAYDAKLAAPKLDLKKARQLLDAAGFAQGTTLKAVTYAGREPERRQVELTQQTFKEIGITLSTEFLQSAAAFELYKKGGHHLFFSSFSARADPHGGLGEQFLSKGGFAWFSDPTASELEPEVDALLIKANEVYKQEERTALYSQVQDLIVNKYAMAGFQYYLNRSLGVSKTIGSSGPFINGDGKPRYTEFYLKA